MKHFWIFLLVSFCFSYTNTGNADVIALPIVGKNLDIGMMEALESRTGLRHFNGKTIPLDQIAVVLWAGYGAVVEKNGRTAHGYDTVSGATSKNKLTIPSAWGKHYLRIFLLMPDGSYRYEPSGHKLILVSTKNIMDDCGANASHPSGVFLIAVDYMEMPGKNTDVAYMSAGAAAQNMILAGTAFGVHMLLQTGFKRDAIVKGMNLPDSIRPLAIIPFGRAK